MNLTNNLKSEQYKEKTILRNSFLKKTVIILIPKMNKHYRKIEKKKERKEGKK